MPTISLICTQGPGMHIVLGGTGRPRGPNIHPEVIRGQGTHKPVQRNYIKHGTILTLRCVACKIEHRPRKGQPKLVHSYKQTDLAHRLVCAYLQSTTPNGS